MRRGGSGDIARFTKVGETRFPNQFKTEILDPEHIFDCSGKLHQLIADEADRNFVLKRIRSYLDRKRRGNFRLPSRLHSVQVLLRTMSRSELYRLSNWYSPENSHRYSLNQRGSVLSNQVLPGWLWNPPIREVAYLVDYNRLSSTDMPRISRRAWPSTPTFTEMLAGIRVGFTFTGPQKPDRVIDPIRPCHMNDIRVASRVVSNNVIGIRVLPKTVPRKFLPWFRYREGFLILVSRYCLPAGLTRFLLSVWKTNPRSLWLRRNCLLKYYLRSTSLGSLGSFPSPCVSQEEDGEESRQTPPFQLQEIPEDEMDPDILAYLIRKGITS